jgi:phosphatidylserine/phosphatidylglycerophosphate/cardiolipin synthase-like enzyme
MPARDRLVIEPGRRRRAVIGLIGSAQRRLVLSIFRCSDQAVLTALAAAVGRGVPVSAIVTDRAKASAGDLDRLCGWLLEHGIAVRRHAGSLKYHAKYIVADETTALVTSLNFTAKCFERTCDFLLLTKDAKAIAGLAGLFAADWAGSKVALAPAQLERLIVGPDHAPRDRFAALLLGARRRIRVLDAKLTDPGMRQLLESRRRAGIVVEMKRRKDIRPLASHGRLLVIDDDVAVIGSFALSTAALERRRELAVISREPAVLRALDEFWYTHARRRPSRDAEAARSLELRP